MRRIALLAALFVVASLEAQAVRPKIGLALGGGGARGGAHVGVLRALEEAHIPVDYIAGTSMGAVVGGMYASGMSPDEIERTLTTTDWRDALNDRTKYKDLAFRRKQDDNRYLTAVEAGVRGGRVVLPGGLRSGQKLRFLLQSHLLHTAGVRDFSQLPIPFRAVATDIETGEAVVLDHGDLAAAIRASMSIPGVFSPMELDGKVLVDGGVADNVPVDVVRRMGADIVIAIDVGSPLMKRDQLGSMLAVTGQVLTILTRRNAQEQLRNADVVLTPPVSQYATMDFESVAQIIAIGTAYGREQVKSLGDWRVASGEWQNRQSPSANRQAPINDITIEGTTRVDERIIRNQLSTKTGTTLDAERLRRDVTRLYGLDDFEQVNFAVDERDGRRRLALDLKDKPWGPTYLRFGLNLNDDLRGDSTYEVVANVTRTRLNARGGEWRNDFRLGRNAGVVSELYQPLDFRGRFFVAPSVEFRRNRFPLFEGERKVALLDVDGRHAALDLGIQFHDWGALRAGVYHGRVHASVDAGSVELPRTSVSAGGFRGSLTIVRTDSPTIPREGGSLVVQYVDSRRSLGATDRYAKLSGAGLLVVSHGRQSFFGSLAGGTSLGTTLPIYDEHTLGGLLNLGGFATGQLHGQRFALARAGTYVLLRNLPANLGGGVYAGLLGEAGNAWSSSDHPLHRSATLLLGADTLVGPIFVALARADTGRERFYVTIGKTF